MPKKGQIACNYCGRYYFPTDWRPVKNCRERRVRHYDRELDAIPVCPHCSDRSPAYRITMEDIIAGRAYLEPTEGGWTWVIRR